MNQRVSIERNALSAKVEELKDNNNALETRLSALEANSRLAEEEKRACNEEYNNQVRALGDNHDSHKVF